jgi:preprotein translocase subunit SecD
MKTIFYVVLLCITLILPGLYVRNPEHNIFLYPSGGSATAEQLSRSAQVLTSRLKIFAPNSPVRVSAEKDRIKIRIPRDLDSSIPEGLLITPGSVGFFETLTAGELASLKRMDPPANPSEARLACSSSMNSPDADSLRAFLESDDIFSGYKLMWGAGNDEAGFCIYAVKKDPSLTRNDIESVGSGWDKESQAGSVTIRFRPASAATWAELTRKNLGKPLALVIDDKVFYTPIVKTPMEGGLCEITGSFPSQELDYLRAIAGSGILPVELSIR